MHQDRLLWLQERIQETNTHWDYEFFFFKRREIQVPWGRRVYRNNVIPKESFGWLRVWKPKKKKNTAEDFGVILYIYQVVGWYAGQNGKLPLSLKSSSKMLLFWNYIVKCPYFETRFSKNRISVRNSSSLKNFKWKFLEWNSSSINLFIYF